MSCLECFSGHVHEGHPRGKAVKLYGLDVYVSEPTRSRPIKGIIVIVSDALGWEFVNSRLLADNYADKGDFKVYLPDFMHGAPAPLWLLDSIRGFHTSDSYLSKLYHFFWVVYGHIPFFWSHGIGKSHPVVKGWFSQLRKEEGDNMGIGAAGFCWGGKHTVLLAAGEEVGGRPLLDAGFTAHPSLLSIPSDIEKLTVPVAFAIGTDDSMLPEAKCKKIKEVVEALPESSRGEIRLYEGCGHGFAVRADTSGNDANVAVQATKAEDHCIQWFKKHFREVAL